MPTEFTMPKLGLTMEEGTIVEWMVAEGERVRPGTAVVVVETDKVTTEVEVPDGGRLHFVGIVGSTYLCGELIGQLLADGEAWSGVRGGGGPAGARLLASPFAHRRAGELAVDIRTVAGTGPGGRITSEDVEAAHAAAPVAAPLHADAASARRGPAPAATFAAAELARLVGVDLAGTAILATAPDGRISRQDVADHVRALLARGVPPVAAAIASPAPLTQEPTGVVPLKGMRGTIATRMRASLGDMAQLTLMMDADMDAVVADRDARKGSASVPGYTDYVLAAAARALRDHPRVNSQVTADGIALLPGVNVGIAVALDEGLLVPVVHDADRIPLEEISVRTTSLAEAARAGRLKLADLEGGTFSVSALGMFGVDGFTPIINPPNVAILGVGRLRDDVAWAPDGAIRRARRLTLSLTWDHRAFDGAPAAEFVRSICRYLDDPSTLR